MSSTSFGTRHPAGAIAGGAVLAAALVAADAAPLAAASSSRAVCDPIIARIEQSSGLPAGLLRAMAHVESGRILPGGSRRVAWAWAANIGGRAHYFATKSEAVDRIETALRAGQSVDAGCLQINLSRWHRVGHGEAFEDVASALTPEVNVTYAANLLKTLHARHGNWTNAVGYYNASSYSARLAYVCRVAVAQSRIVGTPVPSECPDERPNPPVPKVKRTPV